MQISQKLVYWLGFFLYLRTSLIVLYNLCNPFEPLYLAYYLMTEFFVDIFIVLLRPDTRDEKLFTIIHHSLLIGNLYNECKYNFTNNEDCSYKLVHAFIFAAGFDLIGFSQILFKNYDITRLLYIAAIIRTIFALVSPIHIATLGANWLTYIGLSFNIFVACGIWMMGPKRCFPNPHA